VHVREERQEQHVVVEPPRLTDAVVGIPGRDAEVRLEHQLGGNFPLHARGIGEPQGDARAVGLLRPDRGVVHHEDQLPAGRDALGHAGREGQGRRALRHGGQAVGAERPLQPDAVLARRLEEDVAVVNNPRVARPDFGRHDPAAFAEAGVDVERLVLDDAGGGHPEVLRHGDHGVGLADGPALRERGGRRQVGGVTLGAARVDPGEQQFSFGVGQARVVGEAAVTRVGPPRRHAAGLHHLADGAGPGGRVAVASERERPGPAGSVADLAAPLHDRCDVAAPRHRPGDARAVRVKE
jgi:hypothetical protein